MYNIKGKISFVYDYSKKKVLRYDWDTTLNKFPVLIDNIWIEHSIDSPPLLLTSDNPTRRIPQIIKYPPEAAINDISGKVLVAFIVDQNGNMTNPQIMKSDHPSLNAEALRVFLNVMDTKWFPALKNGRPVTIEYFQPVIFSLR